MPGEMPSSHREEPSIPDKVFTVEEMNALEGEIIAALEQIDQKKHNPYHNAEHATAVLGRVKELVTNKEVIAALSLSESQAQGLRIAALFHDYEHVGKNQQPYAGENEIHASNEATAFAKKRGLSNKQIDFISDLIMATMVDVETAGSKNDLERLFTLADGADWIETPEEWLKSRAALFKEVQINDPQRFKEKVLDVGVAEKIASNLVWVREHRMSPEAPWQNKNVVAILEKFWGNKLQEKEAIAKSLIEDSQSPWLEIYKKQVLELLSS